MDNLKIQAIIPSSISQISYANEQSDLASIPYHKINEKDRLNDYQIKINGPDYKDSSAIYDQKYQRGDKQYGHIQGEENIMPTPELVEYKGKITGYELYRDTFSQQEILKAFNIIDVNKDDVITEDDLTFVLDYMKEDYTIQEVKQMISMLSSDKKQVTFQDFKKLGKGEVMPLAKFKIPDSNTKDKIKILENIEETELIHDDPQFLIQCMKRESVSYNRFEQSKKGIKKENSIHKTKGPAQDKLFSAVPLRAQGEFKQRRELFMNIVMSSIDDILHNYQEYKQKMLNISKIASMLEIQPRQAKQLYSNNSQVDSLLVMMEAIVYSHTRKQKKLQLCLEVANGKNTVSINQLIHIIQVLKGKDESIEKKIKAIMQSKKIKNDEPILKNEAYEIVLQFSNRLML